MIKFFPINFSTIDTRSRNAIKQVFLAFGFQGLSIIIGFLLVPMLIDFLDRDRYGIWLTLANIIGWFSFFDIGLGNGLRNKLTECFAINDYKLAQKYISTTYAFLLIIFGFLLLLFHVVNSYVNWNYILNTKLISPSELYLLTSVVFTFFFLRFILQLISVIYLANQTSSINNIINTISSVITFALIYLVLKIEDKNNIVLLGFILSAVPVVVFLIITFCAFRGQFKSIRPNFVSVDFKLTKGLFSLGINFFMLQVTSILIFSTSSFFITQFFGPSEVVNYNILYKYFQIPVMLFSIILSPIWSAVTDAYYRQDFDWLKATLRRLNYYSFFMVLIIVFMFIFCDKLMEFWLKRNLHLPTNLKIVMAIYSGLIVLLAPYSNFINGFGKINLTVKFTYLGIVIYFISVYTIGRCFNNSTGLILSILFTSIIGAILQPIQTYKILSGNSKNIWNK